MKAFKWIKDGWVFASGFENVKPFYLLYSAFFLVCALCLVAVTTNLVGGFASVLSGPSGFENLLDNALRVVPILVIAFFGLLVGGVFVDLVSYYGFAGKRKKFFLASKALVGGIIALILGVVLQSIVTSFFDWFPPLGFAISLFSTLALLFVLPAYAFEKNVLKALESSVKLFTNHSLELIVFFLVSTTISLGLTGAALILVAIIIGVSFLIPLIPISLITIPLSLLFLARVFGFLEAFNAGAMASAYLNTRKRRRKISRS